MPPVAFLLIGAHTLGLDAALAAAAWRMLSVRCLGLIRIHSFDQSAVALFFAVWGIYLLDRLWDGQRSKEKLLAERHRFASHHPRWICMTAIISLMLAGFFSIHSLSLHEWGACLCVGMLCAFYYLARWKYPQWERGRAAVIGAVFALGILLPIVPIGVHAAITPNFVLLALGLTSLLVSNASLCMAAEISALKKVDERVVWPLALSLISFTILSLHHPMTGFCGLVAVLGTGFLLGIGDKMNPEHLVALADGILFVPPLVVSLLG